MRELITNDPSTCVGCNRCMRVCPIEGASVAYIDGDNIKVRIDHSRCIACGACIQTCQHKSREYCDDTDLFFADLQRGEAISVFAAPANRANGENWGRLLTWLRQQGVRKIYDVSLGADICTWAYIRYIQKTHPASVITQPCPAIVNYVVMHNHDLLQYLSPVQSPMLCTAIYMKKYEHISDKIAAISPCIAKAHEFEATKQVHYNVTLKKLYEYIQRRGISLPQQESGFDHPESSLGCVFSIPGGLKENVELHLGKTLRIDKCEGQGVVYDALKTYSERSGTKLPDIFDVLNCPEGCNLGTGCIHERDMFEINYIMDEARKNVLQNRDKADPEMLYEEFDRVLRLNDFMRSYVPQSVAQYSVTDAQIEHAFDLLGKKTETERKYDCSACGSDTCLDMAKKIAYGFNIPKNCLQKARDDIHREHSYVLELSSANLSSIKDILEDIAKIKSVSDGINRSISDVNEAIESYSNMAREIDRIALKINIISLNASVEAARAGEHGKTFAVVAEEIRSLSRSSKATVSETEQINERAGDSIKAINAMIDQISADVDSAYRNITDISDKTQRALA